MSVFMVGKDHEAAWQGLNKALGFMRTEIAKRIRLRFAPNLILVKDTSMEYSAHIEGLLKKIKEEEGPRMSKHCSCRKQPLYCRLPIK